jgi:hypothetical protein
VTGRPAGDPSAEADADALRRLERMADRLRVVGPRLAGREGESARELLERIRAGLQRLADLAADAEGEPRRTVPDLAAHALGDVAMVLGQDLLAACSDTSDERSGEHLGATSAERRAVALRAFEDINLLI